MAKVDALSLDKDKPISSVFSDACAALRGFAQFRIESGLNCVVYAFASGGHLLPVLLKEFREKRDQLAETFQPMVKSYYETMGWEYPDISIEDVSPKITVQGGIGTNGEMKRLLEGAAICLEIANEKPYKGENLASLRTTVAGQKVRLHEIFKVEV